MYDTMRVLSIDPGTKNLALCVLDTDVITFWKVCAIPSDVYGVIHVLDTVLHDIEYDETVIERQPPKNRAMKRFEHLFEMYFAMRRKPVHVIDSRQKLACASKTPFWTGDKGTLSYYMRKKVSVSTVARFLDATRERHPMYHDFFMASKKKDDLADALLQAQAFCVKTNVKKCTGTSHDADFKNDNRQDTQDYHATIRERCQGIDVGETCVETDS
jgi:hypothetical protein